jgi:hypothetical protein
VALVIQLSQVNCVSCAALSAINCVMGYTRIRVNLNKREKRKEKAASFQPPLRLKERKKIYYKNDKSNAD